MSAEYPEAAEAAGIEGTVLVGLVRDRMCTVKQKMILQALGYGLDELALRTIDRRFEDALTAQDFPCGGDTLIVAVSFQLRD